MRSTPRRYSAPKQKIYPPLTSGRARAAVMIELAPGVFAVVALAYVVGLIALNISTGFEPPLAVAVLLFFAMVLVCCCGGVGWIVAGRRDVGWFVLVLRASLLMLTLWAGLFAFLSPSCSGCPTSYSPLIFFGAVFSIGELVALGSAARLHADLSRRRKSNSRGLEP